jgi:hypothetical protein
MKHVETDEVLTQMKKPRNQPTPDYFLIGRMIHSPQFLHVSSSSKTVTILNISLTFNTLTYILVCIKYVTVIT